MTDPLTSASSRVGGVGAGEGEENVHRMMASTTVFVLEPGASSLGKLNYLFSHMRTNVELTEFAVNLLLVHRILHPEPKLTIKLNTR